MTARASRLLGSVWWLFAAATVFFVAMTGFAVWRFVVADAAYTTVTDVTSFRTPEATSRPTLHLLLQEEVADALPANQPVCRSAAGQTWQGSLLDNVSATRDGQHWLSVLELPKGWRTGDRITCTGVSGPALLVAQDKTPALIRAGVGAVAALLAAGFTVAGLLLRPRRQQSGVRVGGMSAR